METFILADLDEIGDDENGNHGFVDEHPNWVEGWVNPFVVVNPFDVWAGLGGGGGWAQVWGDGWNFSPATTVSARSSAPAPSDDEEGEVVEDNPFVNPFGNPFGDPFGGGLNAEIDYNPFGLVENGGLMGENAGLNVGIDDLIEEILGNQALNAGIGEDEQANQGINEGIGQDFGENAGINGGVDVGEGIGEGFNAEIVQNVGENAGFNGGLNELIEEALSDGIGEGIGEIGQEVEELGQIPPRNRISLADLLKANNIDDDEERREDDEPRQRESDAVWIKKPMGFLCCGCGSQGKKVKSSQEEDFER